MCISHPASPAIYSLDLVYCALSKCQHCQSGPPISSSPCCWALLVFISADRWTLRVIPPTPLHLFVCPPIYFLSYHLFSGFLSSAMLPILYSLLQWLCLVKNESCVAYSLSSHGFADASCFSWHTSYTGRFNV